MRLKGLEISIITINTKILLPKHTTLSKTKPTKTPKSLDTDSTIQKQWQYLCIVLSGKTWIL